MTRLAAVTLVVGLVASGGAAVATGPDAGRAAVPAAPVPVAGTACRPFPADNYWNTSIRALPVDPRSATWMSHMSSDRRLHPDFGPSYGDGPNYGIPAASAEVQPSGRSRLLPRDQVAPEPARQ